MFSVGPQWALLILLLSLVLGGCAGADDMVKQVPYVAPAAPGPTDTLIYVFREDGSVLASARELAVIDNDTVVAALAPGTFSYFIVPSGEHEIVGYIAPSPIMHYRVLHAPGQTVFLFCRIGYASGLFMERIDEARAQQLLSQYKYTEIGVKGAKAKMDYKAHYDKLYR